jgi:hypothetical protein
MPYKPTYPPKNCYKHSLARGLLFHGVILKPDDREAFEQLLCSPMLVYLSSTFITESKLQSFVSRGWLVLDNDEKPFVRLPCPIVRDGYNSQPPTDKFNSSAYVCFLESYSCRCSASNSRNNVLEALWQVS